MNTRKSRGKNEQWDALIEVAKTKIKQTKLKSDQLEAILADFKLKRRAGETCPTELSWLKSDG